MSESSSKKDTAAAPYFVNHDRRLRFPWSLYHGDLMQRLASSVRSLPRRHDGSPPRVLIVGCGLEPYVEGAPSATYFGVDLDPGSIQTCRERFPEMADRLEVCPSPYELPSAPPFDERFDAIVAKEVIEHLEDPTRWTHMLVDRLAPGGMLLLTTPNYGTFSTLPLLERTVLEVVARLDGYSRKHIHPSRFDRKRLERLDVGAGVELLGVDATWTRWALLGRWQKRR
ncbi:MAG: class I SAM-dependent methyltransferase [Deltaproteobacteria bacterium]|nr:class I SAM-dependent methyltransferase [Deltaproteobacteria bacterium]